MREAKAFEIPVEFDGVKVTLRARLFIKDGGILAVRHLVLLGNGRQTFPKTDVGKFEGDLPPPPHDPLCSTCAKKVDDK